MFDAVQLTPPASPDATLAGLSARYRAALWRYVRVLGADASFADDLVQEAFLVAISRPNFDATVPGAVFRFLRTTARHLWLKAQRWPVASREVTEADAVWEARCGDGDGDGEAYVEALRRCMARLPAKSRALLHATYTEGHGRTATAARFGMREDGVKSALRRLRAFLHDCIERRRKESAT